jgi:ABC-2 type transport system permease protein
MGRLRALVRKEFRQFFRRKPLIVLVVWTIAVEIALCAAAITYDVRHVRLAVRDLDGSPASRELVARFAASEYFDLAFRPRTPREMDGLLETGRATVVLVIPPDFSRLLGQGLEAPVQLLLDGSNSNYALVALGYAQRILTAYARELDAARLRTAVGDPGPLPLAGASGAPGTTRASGACTSRSCPC